MIYVTSDNCVGRYVLDITGHAESGEHGHDLVCSASSILLYTLAANLEQLEDEGEISSLSCEIYPGHAHIEFDDADDSGESIADTVFNAFLVGYELLAATFGDCVQIGWGGSAAPPRPAPGSARRQPSNNTSSYLKFSLVSPYST